MTDNEIKKALEYCSDEGRKNCKNCPIYKITNCFGTLSGETVDLINRQQAENDDLFYKLTGVMHSVDKWLDGDELKQDEVNRAATMREKTLQIVEKQQAEIDELRHEREVLIEDIHHSADKINEQLEEIEELQIENKSLRSAANCYKLHYNEARTEAYKSFAECLKEEWSNNYYDSPDVDFDEFVDNLLKELVGED